MAKASVVYRLSKVADTANDQHDMIQANPETNIFCRADFSVTGGKFESAQTSHCD